jgi:hypothetical protein
MMLFITTAVKTSNPTPCFDAQKRCSLLVYYEYIQKAKRTESGLQVFSFIRYVLTTTDSNETLIKSISRVMYSVLRTWKFPRKIT